MTRRAMGGWLVVMGLAAATAGCGPSTSAAAPDDITAAIQAADARLKGSWKLVRFDPEQPLGPTLQAMLEYQYQALTVHFDGKRVKADSPGINFDRPYQVREANADRFKLISFDEQGVAYESVCEFGPGDTLVIHSKTAPWQGVGTMRRSP